MEFGPYRTDAELGRGGMGVVFRASHHATGAPVALKVPDRGGGTEEQRARFRREAAIGAALDHPAIVSVVDHDADGDPPWLALELIEGEPLGRWAKRAAPGWREAVAIARTSSRESTGGRSASGVPSTGTSALMGTEPGWGSRFARVASIAQRSPMDSPMPMIPPQHTLMPFLATRASV